MHESSYVRRHHSCMKTLFIILLSCFCLCLAAPLLQAEQGNGCVSSGDHFSATHAYTLTEAELLELEDPENQVSLEPSSKLDELNPDLDASTSSSILPKRHDTSVSETPRYIRVRHLLI